MKIKINNIFKNIKDKFNFKKNSNNKEAKVIKFNNPFKEENEDSNIENKNTRTGYIQKAKGERKKVDKNVRKVFVGMVMLLLLTTTLNIRYKDYLKFEEVEAKDISSVAVSSNVENSNDIQQEIVKATKAEEKIVVPKKVEEKLVFGVPLKGEIQKMYSVDKVIYSKTLAQWKTHDGIDISASENQEVKSIEKGIVKSIEHDSFYGVTIKIEHINGYMSVYSNLDEKVYVNLGEKVVKGQKIGKVGTTSVGEYLDDSHLHFMLYLNGKSINPTYIFE